MVKIVGVRFKRSGKTYYFDPMNEDLEQNDAVIVETARGVEFGIVRIAPKDIEESALVSPLKPVIRKATNEDIEIHRNNLEKEKDAFSLCEDKIKEHKLVMKLVDAEFTFDNNKVIFYFTSEGRVDFRELVKDLASIFRTRIELRQIGVRDEAKMLGGIGPCGKSLCCSTFLSDFTSVSIKMAKDQNLSLNPSKISGICGRLMCCLKYEQDTYEEIRVRLPRVGSIVETEEGVGEVVLNNTIKEQVKVKLNINNEDVLKYFKIDDVKLIKGKYEDVNEDIKLQELEIEDPSDINLVKDLIKENKETKDNKEKHHKEHRNYREHREHKDLNDQKEHRNFKENRQPKEQESLE